MVDCCALGVVGEAAVVCLDGVELVVDVLAGFAGLRDLGRIYFSDLLEVSMLWLSSCDRHAFAFVRSLGISSSRAPRLSEQLGRDVAVFSVRLSLTISVSEICLW